MPARFGYYARLSKSEQAVYRQSDRVAWIDLGDDTESLRALTAAIEPALRREKCDAVRAASHALCAAICARLEVRIPSVRVLRVRPRGEDASELHGLYTTGPRTRPLIRVWMRTAAQQRVVSFRTFVRTLLHELAHHLDFELFGLPDSYHTLGFFKRESSLVRQLVPRAATSS
jgi:hypothetical protein